MEVVLRHGGEIDAIDDLQETPLDTTLRVNNVDAVALLEGKGARRACDVLKLHSWVKANVHLFIH